MKHTSILVVNHSIINDVVVIFFLKGNTCQIVTFCKNSRCKFHNVLAVNRTWNYQFGCQSAFFCNTINTNTVFYFRVNEVLCPIRCRCSIYLNPVCFDGILILVYYVLFCIC